MSDQVALDVQAEGDEFGVTFAIRPVDCKGASVTVHIPRGLNEEQGDALGSLVGDLGNVLDRCVDDLERRSKQ